jgi:hypothetical protein
MPRKGSVSKKAPDMNVITYCGLCCLDCHGYKQKVPDLARDLRKELRDSKYKKFAYSLSKYTFGRPFKGYDTCYEVLGAMVRFRCHKGCRSGGGPPFCKIRKCCIGKKLDGCWECGNFEGCKKLDFLRPVHGDGHIRNLRAIKKKGTAAFLKGKRDW